MSLSNILNFDLYHSGDFSITPLKLFILLLLIVVSFFLDRIGVHWANRISGAGGVLVKYQRNLIRGARVIFFFIVVVFALKIVGVNSTKLLSYSILNTGKIEVLFLHILVAFGIIFFTRIVVSLIKFYFNKQTELSKIGRGRSHSITLIAQYCIWFVAIIFIFSIVGADLTFFIASSAALLVALGFGLQNLFNDFISGIIILFDRSLQVDDIVELNDGFIGKVVEINLRVSKILTRDNEIIIVPNSMFTKDLLTNWSHNEENTRFHVSVSVAYGSDVRLVEKILIATATDHPAIIDDPTPFVRFGDFGESSLDFRMYFWTADSFTVENIKSDLRFEIDARFRAENIVIPFPQRDLHLQKSSI